MRISPIGLYITYKDIDRLVQVLDYVLVEGDKKITLQTTTKQ